MLTQQFETAMLWKTRTLRKDTEEGVLMLNFLYQKVIGRYDISVGANLMKRPDTSSTTTDTFSEAPQNSKNGRQIRYLQEDLRRFKNGGPSSAESKMNLVFFCFIMIKVHSHFCLYRNTAHFSTLRGLLVQTAVVSC